MEGFIFGGNTGVATPQELAKKRELVQAIMARNAASQPKNVWEGLNSAAESITGALKERRLDKAEAAGIEGANSAYAPIIEALKNKQPVGNDLLMGALSNQWANEGQRGIAESLLKNNMEADAPLTKWQQAQLAENDTITPYQQAMIDAARQKAAGDGPKRGLNGVWAQSQDGSWHYLQASDAGGAMTEATAPEGMNVMPPTTTQDFGTYKQPVTTRGGVLVGEPMPVDIAGKASLDAQGEAAGKATAAAPGDLQAGENAVNLIDSIRNDPYKGRGTGFSSILNAVPGTGGYDFQNKVNQAKSGAFLTSIQQMRGLGQLSNAEGSAATAAINRMETATSEEAFDSALNDYETIVRQGMARAQKRIPSGLTGSGDPGAAKRLKFNPDTGELE